MNDFFQGDIIKIQGFKNRLFVIVSKNAFIKATGMFHVCPLIPDVPAGPLHIKVTGRKGCTGTAICEQVKIIDPSARGCTREDALPYEVIMDVSDAIQGIFEYD